MQRYRWGIVSLLLLFPVFVQAQFVDYGTDPARYKWNYVATPHYKIIYPRGIDSIAYRYTQLLENVYPPLGKTIGPPVKGRYPVVLHPGSMLSNGMVAWAPWRMELVTTPSSDLYAQSWDRQLAIHESRHVYQTGRLMRGIFRPLYYLGGEQVSGLADFAVPRWFFEGDAVAAETAMSNSGRGRLPEFNLYYRTRLLSGDFFSFDKWFMGSYKDYTGSFYALGYDMTAYARQAYGADIWEKVTDRYVRRILHLPPFSSALKHYTGVNTHGLFKETFRYLEEEWKAQAEQAAPFTRLNVLSPAVNQYTSYQYPQPLDDGRVIAVKSSFSDLSSLVVLQEGREQFLSYLGNINSRIQVKGNRVYWTEHVSGLRWTHENYSVLKYLDLSTGRVRTLTPGERYLAPAVSPDGTSVALYRYNPDGTSEVVMVDAERGEVQQTFPVQRSRFLKELAFDTSQSVVAVCIDDKGLSIERLLLPTRTWEVLLPAGAANITSLSVNDGMIWFESGLDGINNIYRLDPVGKHVYQLTSARFGLFQPALTPSGDLLVADYQSQGFRVAVAAPKEWLEQKADFSEPYRFSLAETVAGQEGYNMDTVALTPVPFEPKPYRKMSHLFNVHSWAPFYYDVTEAVNLSTDDFTTIVKPGATVISQNHLNTAITQAGVYYRNDDWHGKLAFTYMGWYPVIDLMVDVGGNALDINWYESDGYLYTGGYYPGRKLVEAEVKVYVPFNLTKDHYVQGIQPSLSWYYTNHRYQQIQSGKMRDFQYLLGELRFYRYRKMAQRDILPRWGYQMRLQYLHTPFQTENYADLYAARLTTYWPGILRNHSLMLRAGYQYQPVESKAMYVPKRLLETPRGYSYDYRSLHQYAFKADYAFSLFCPDVSLGAWFYIKRVRTNLFYDLTRAQAYKGGGWNTQSSVGGDLIVDWNIFRLNYPISLGIRIANPIDYGSVTTEALFSVSF
ncbi:MAG: hypothetical protein LUG98_16765 [Tannerellaceae bacterium]|nr:hypothetical protein [Tannerellaceae bacterium]